MDDPSDDRIFVVFFAGVSDVVLQVLQASRQVWEEEEEEVEPAVLRRLFQAVLLDDDADLDPVAQQVGHGEHGEEEAFQPRELAVLVTPG